mgnify:CR=1 FL=1|jgi:hypothetical protein
MLITENFNVKVNSRINDILDSDKTNFNIVKKNAMINTIVSYYLKFEVKRIEEEIRKKVKAKYGQIKTNLDVENIIELIYDLRRQESEKEKNSPQLNFRLNKDTFEDYENYMLDIQDEKVNITKFFREIFEWYCGKKQCEREKILYYKEIETIERQLLKKNLRKNTLKIKVKTLGIGEKSIELAPLGIVTSKNENYSYLLGYSEGIDIKTLEKTGKFAIYPTRISNILEIKPGKTFKIVKDDEVNEDSLYLIKESVVKEVEKRIEEKIITYGEEKEIKVELTERGKKMLEIIIHNRPFTMNIQPEVVENNGEKKYIYTFKNTYFSVETYFFSFGKECRVLSPEGLKEKFKKNYEEALKIY